MMRQNFSVRILNSKNNPAEESIEGYVPLENGEQFSVVLKNNNNFDAIAAIKIDGKDIAHVKVEKHGKTIIDAPIDSDQKFTFYKKESKEGKSLELSSISRDDLGLIQVSFLQVEEEVQFKPHFVNTHLVYVPTYPWWWDYPWWRPILTVNYPSQPLNPNYTISNSIGGMSTSNGVAFSSVSNQDVQFSHTAGSSCNMSSGGTGLSGEAEFLPRDVEKSREQYNKKYDSDNVLTISLRLIWKKSKEKVGPTKLVGYSNPIPAPV